MNEIINNFSIIIPTFHEAKNIPELISRIAGIHFAGIHFEVILVDDNSQDGTPIVVEELKQQYSWLKCVVRKNNKGLSASVMEGFQHARYPVCVVMDADLSHPPEKIPELLAALARPHVDLVIGSRYVKGGSSDKTWSLMRKIISRSAAFVTMIFLNLSVKDPLSGFLAIRKSTYHAGILLKPIGWKIGLEMMIKCPCKTIVEVPIHFSERTQGMSKLNYKILLTCMKHIMNLLWFKLSKA